MTPLERIGEVLASYTKQERRKLRKVAGLRRQSARYQRRAIKAFRRYDGEQRRRRAEAAVTEVAA